MLLHDAPFSYPGIIRGRRAITGADTAVAGDRGICIDATSGTFSVGATAAATLGSGYAFALYNSGSGVVTFDPTSGETIQGPTGTATTFALAQGQGAVFQTDGSNWKIVLGVGLTPASGATLTVADDKFFISGSSDATKLLRHEVDGLTAGATRVWTALDANIVVAGSASALTSGRFPYITTGGLLVDDDAHLATATTLILGNGTSANAYTLVVNALAGQNAQFNFRKGGLNRWINQSNNTAESGSNAGSDWDLLARNDSGGAIDTALSLARVAGGALTMGAGRGITMSGNITQTGATTVSTGTGVGSLNCTTDATAAATAAYLIAGGVSIAKNALLRQGIGLGVSSTATAAGTTTLTNASRVIQTFTGSTTQTINFPAANAFGAGIAVIFCINNQSSGTVTPTRAGSDTFQGGGTTDPVLAGATQWYASDGVSVWLKVT